MAVRLKTRHEYFPAKTSALAKRIGDTILVAGTAMSAVSLETMPHWVTYLSLALTMLGKMVSNFFTDLTYEDVVEEAAEESNAA